MSALTPQDLQILLMGAGYPLGRTGADGIWGDKTASAMETWFRDGIDLITDERPTPTIARDKFFTEFKKQFGLASVNQQQVDGFDAIFDEYESRGWTNVNMLAYMLSTGWWETGKTMAPVKEAYWMSEEWRKRNLRYYPYYGRGLVQLTWLFNYQKAGEAYGIDLVSNPDRVLDLALSVQIMFDGMEAGWFTGKALDDYIDDIDEPDSEDLKEYINARRIINGTDKATTIGQNALKFEAALRGAM